MTEQTINGAPTPHQIRGFGKSITLPWATKLGELIDNAFDADASQISISFQKSPSKKIIVQDDGKGCDDLRKMVSAGVHCASKRGTVGMYGVGLKQVAWNLWGAMEINSLHKSGISFAAVDWERYSRQDSWDIPFKKTDNTTGATGTNITFSNPTGWPSDFEKLIEELGWIYAPALQQGKRIQIVAGRRSYFVTAWEMPILEESVEDVLWVNGKRADVKIGIVKKGEKNPKHGLTYCYYHRNILCTPKGVGATATASICGIVKLGSNWELGTNKTEIVSGADDLEAAILAHPKFSELLKKAHERSVDVEHVAFANRLSDTINSQLRKGTERRNQTKEQAGTVVSIAPERKRRKASKVSGPGEAISKYIRGGKFTVEFLPFDDNKPGRCDLQGRRVYFNTNNVRVARCRKDQNIDALTFMFEALFANELVDSQFRDEFPYFKGERLVEVIEEFENSALSVSA